MRGSSAFVLVASAQTLVLGALLLNACAATRRASGALAEKRDLVRRLALTDLCLFTDARYTRHPSQADLSTPFQDHPASLEHFPSGSFLPPPAHLASFHAPLD